MKFWKKCIIRTDNEVYVYLAIIVANHKMSLVFKKLLSWYGRKNIRKIIILTFKHLFYELMIFNWYLSKKYKGKVPFPTKIFHFNILKII